MTNLFLKYVGNVLAGENGTVPDLNGVAGLHTFRYATKSGVGKPSLAMVGLGVVS